MSYPSAIVAHDDASPLTVRHDKNVDLKILASECVKLECFALTLQTRSNENPYTIYAVPLDTHMCDIWVNV